MPGSSKIFYNGNIITMEPSLYKEAIMVENGVIRATGSFNELIKQKTAQTQMIDLQNRTMIPAFINPFGSLFAYAESLRYVSLKDASSFDGIVKAMQGHKERVGLREGQWLIGYGYDHSRLAEKTHPDKNTLDKISAVNPVLICHESKSKGAVNSAGLARLGITKETPAPRDGIIGHFVDTGEPNGYLEEAAFTDFILKIPEPEKEVALDFLQKAQKAFLQCGITAVREIRMNEKKWELLREADGQSKLLLDIFGCTEFSPALAKAGEAPPAPFPESVRLKQGGYFFAVDNSLRKRASWLTLPYRNASDGYCGYPLLKEEQMFGLIRRVLTEKAPLAVACSGDAALEHFLTALKKASAELEVSPRDSGVTVSAVMARPDQLAELKELGTVPSFAVSGIYYWGDADLENVGAERAMSLYPLNSAASRELPFSLHPDFNRLPDMLEAIRCAEGRVSSGGIVMGEAEKVPPPEALKAVTLHAAMACGEGERRGSLKAGKKADLAVLSGNPLTVSPAEMKEIRVIKTYKDGAEVYSEI